MLEREFDLGRLSQKSADKPFMTEGASFLAQRATQHFQEAISLLRDPSYFKDHDSVKIVAHALAFSGMPLTEASEMWQGAHHGQKAFSGHEIHVDPEVRAIFGDYGGVESIRRADFSTVHDVMYGARVQVQRGENPTALLNKAEQMAGSFDTEQVTTSNLHQTSILMGIGVLYARAGMEEDARRTFSRSEEIIDTARNEFYRRLDMARQLGKDEHEAFKDALDVQHMVGNHDGEYYRLAPAYASVGWFEDATRVVTKLKKDKSHYFAPAVEELVREEIRAEVTDQAVETAKMLGGVVVTKALAAEAVRLAEQGEPYQEVAQEVEFRLNNNSYDEDYVQYRLEQAKLAAQGGNFFAAESHLGHAKSPASGYDYLEIQAMLGVAAARAGDLDTSRAHFNKAWQVIRQEGDEPEDLIFKVSMMLDFANGLDTAGFNAEGAYRAVIQTCEEMVPDDASDWDKEHGLEADQKWRTYAETVLSLVDRGYLELANEAVAGYTTKTGTYNDSRAAVLAYVAEAEMKAGLHHD